MPDIKTQTLGYPRIGPQREMKRALEAFWKGKLGQDELLAALHQIEADAWSAQAQAGIDFIGVGDATLYDHVADWADRFNLLPERFQAFEGLDRYFAMARGAPGVPALGLTKWFDTNYHYLIPEFDESVRLGANYAAFLQTITRAREAIGSSAVPIVLGPITLLRLSRVTIGLDHALDALLPLYTDLLEDLRQLGVEEVQLHEPALVLEDAPGWRNTYQKAYAQLAEVDIARNLITYFDDLGEAFPWATRLPVDVLTLDFTRGMNADLLEEHGLPDRLTLAAGIVDGRNIWRMQADTAMADLKGLPGRTGLRVSASCSLQFLPYTLANEPNLPEALKGALAFSQEKLGEIQLLARGLSGDDINSELSQRRERWERFRAFAPANPELKARIESLDENTFERSEPYELRREKQIQLPPFPTTTIGSFPQTAEIRKLRASFKRGEISQQEYRDRIDAWIAYTIGVQEGLGLDVLVHGEFERSDMVEYFAQKLEGFTFTENAWVQSYGSRYVRPPIIYADITRPAPMTVREFERAQSFTRKPVKGMLTGPVTILNWSFPRVDIPPREIAFQLALALRQEIADLEAAGARVIQVDEPALREGLPFKRERWHDYLSWAVDAFRLTTGGAKADTQIHTHMCYAEFGDILDAINRLQADVILIENARSGDETLRELAEYDYGREVGPGVYDVHSPVVPEVDQVVRKLQAFVRHLHPEQIWVNPDCGLKTRAWPEVLASLDNLVEAAAQVRAEVAEKEAPLPVGPGD